MYQQYYKRVQYPDIEDTAGAVYCAIGLFVFMIFHFVGII
jgi:hypothetical protein